VPEETRQSLPDGTNGFERVLPGPNRMYPDTDLPPVVVAPARVEGLAGGLPRPPWLRLAWLRQSGVGEDLARRLCIHAGFPLFEDLFRRLGEESRLTPTALASLLLDRSCPRPLSLAAAGEWWRGVADRLAAGEILPEGVWSSDGEPPAAVDDEKGLGLFETALAELKTQASALPADRDRRERAAMGPLMRALRGRVPGRAVRQWVKEAQL